MTRKTQQDRAKVDSPIPTRQDRRHAVTDTAPRPVARLHAGMLKRIDVGGRKQTKVKLQLQPDTLVTMFKHGTLANEHLRAAAEIREIFEALTRHRGRKVINGASYTPVPPKLLDLYERRYKPWAEDLGRRRMNIPGGRLTHLEVVISVIVEGEAMVAMTERLQMPRRSGCRMFDHILRHSLARYSEIVGRG